MKRLMATVAVTAVAILLGSCGDEPELRVERVRLSGTIDTPSGAASDRKVYVSLYHAWALEGELRHPVEFITGFEAAPGRYEFEFDYPVDLGEGLLVYAWVDLDQDGILCTPTLRKDRAGLTEVEGFTPGDVTVNVELVVPCAGPDWFYPPVE